MEAGLLDARPAGDREAIAQGLAGRVPGLVTWSGWQAIDQHERSAGERQGRPRVKLVRLREMLAVARQSPAPRADPIGGRLDP